MPFDDSLIKKNLIAAYFLIYQRTTEFGTSKEILKINRLSNKMALGKENATFLYLMKLMYLGHLKDLIQFKIHQ